MFNKSNLFNKRDEAPSHVSNSSSPNSLGSTVSASDASSGGTQNSSLPRPTPRPGTFGANMRSQFDTNTQTDNSTSATKESAAAKDAKKDGGSCLIVGPDVKLRGAEILDCDTLVVEGRVEATMDSRVIRIAENGSFSGKVGIDVAEINGNFEGELTAREQLIIHATGRVSGTIRYGKILIEEGGEVSGDVQSLGSAKAKKEVKSGFGSDSSSTASSGQDDKIKAFVSGSN